MATKLHKQAKTVTRDIEVVANHMYRYVDFLASVAVAKLPESGYPDSSLKIFHSIARKYVTTGLKREGKASNKFFKTLDVLMATHCAKYRPSEKEKAREFKLKNRQSKNNKKINVKICPDEINSKSDTSLRNSCTKMNISQATLTSVKNQIKIQASKQNAVALLINNTMKLFENEDVLNGYVMACNDIDNTIKLEVVDVVITPRVIEEK